MICLRKCGVEDCDLLYNWSNDRVVRQNSFNISPIPYSEHVNWFNKSLEYKTREIFICMMDSIPVAMVRIDIEESEAIISYLVDENHRGKGLGTQVLKLLYDIVVNEYKHIEKLIGLVKKENVASCKAFKKLGYDSFEEKELNKYVLKL